MKNYGIRIRWNVMKMLVFAMFLVICFTGTAQSQQSGVGMGIMFGEPTGLSMKGWISERSAIDGGLGWSFLNEGSVHIHGDYLYHFYNVFNEPRLPLYLGVGGRIKLKNEKHGETDARIGIRVPFGISYQFSEVPVDVFLEIVPILDLSPTSKGSVNAALGVRYYF
ncbi:MAG: DUF3996 domain-containing protein [Ignavibacteria bacterium]|nr:DUF3996 domain-containing protein [Ignavibacteria bacterium]